MVDSLQTTSSKSAPVLMTVYFCHLLLALGLGLHGTVRSTATKIESVGSLVMSLSLLCEGTKLRAV